MFRKVKRRNEKIDDRCHSQCSRVLHMIKCSYPQSSAWSVINARRWADTKIKVDLNQRNCSRGVTQDNLSRMWRQRVSAGHTLVLKASSGVACVYESPTGNILDTDPRKVISSNKWPTIKNDIQWSLKIAARRTHDSKGALWQTTTKVENWWRTIYLDKWSYYIYNWKGAQVLSIAVCRQGATVGYRD